MKVPFKRIMLAGALLLVVLALAALGLERGVWRFNHPDPRAYPVWGLDVSHHQGTIDWSRVSQTPNMRFAYVKATEGGDWVDAKFRENWDGARSAGLRVGAYHFFSFCSDPVRQANHFLSTLPRSPDSLVPVVDLEFGGNCRNVPSKDVVTKSVMQFLDTVERGLSKKPMLYVTREAYDAFVAGSDIRSRIWIRDIWKQPDLPGWTLWQFANRDHVDGISGFVDLNVLNGSALEQL